MSQAPTPQQKAPSAALSLLRDRVRIGRIVERIGLLGLPLGLGALLGFYAADRGMRLVPTLLEIFLVATMLSLIAIILGRFIRGRAYRISQQELRIRRRIAFSLGVIAVLLLARLALFWSQQPSPLTQLPATEFNNAFAIDSQRYRDLDRGLEQAVVFLEQQALFRQDRVLTVDEERAVLQAWRSIYDQAVALDQIRRFYEDWYRFDVSRIERSFHLRSFLLSFAAELSLYDKASRLVQLTGGNTHAQRFLNTPHPEFNLPDDTLSRIRQELQGERDHSRVLAGREYMKVLNTGFTARDESLALGALWLWQHVEKELQNIASRSQMKQVLMSLGSDVEPLKRAVQHTWYPAQSAVAEWMGDTRTRRIGHYLITAQQLEDMDPLFEPGDIMLARKNWYLSNVSLPGFWPHAELYLGAPDKLRKFFASPEVREHWQGLLGDTVTVDVMLAQKYPRAWQHYLAGEHEVPLRVMEAISEGVVLSTLEHAAGDYLAVLRPRLDRVARSQAIVEAFSHYGKPYDFNFDFATDDALVCTELVWRSYRPATGKAGLNIPLVDVLGRKTLPAHEIARLFAREHGQPSAQFDFVLFIDASEREQRALSADEQAFLETPARLKWDAFLQ